MEQSVIQADVDEKDMEILNAFQRGFPLVDRPYQQIGLMLGMLEEEVIDRLQRLTLRRVVSRVGAVLRTNRVGCSTLAAMEVPVEEIEEVAAIINSFPEVNHNYEREGVINMWFVVVAADEAALATVLEKMEKRCHHKILTMPMVEEYHIDLGFPIH